MKADDVALRPTTSTAKVNTVESIELSLSAYKQIPVTCALLFGFTASALATQPCSQCEVPAVTDTIYILDSLSMTLSFLGLSSSVLMIYQGYKLLADKGPDSAREHFDITKSLRERARVFAYLAFLVYIIAVALCIVTTNAENRAHVSVITAIIFGGGVIYSIDIYFFSKRSFSKLQK